METDKIFSEITNLPPEAQRQVADFIAFLKSRYQEFPGSKKSRKSGVGKEPFIGIWKDREDMEDGYTWLRNVRKKEWSYPGA